MRLQILGWKYRTTTHGSRFFLPQCLPSMLNLPTPAREMFWKQKSSRWKLPRSRRGNLYLNLNLGKTIDLCTPEKRKAVTVGACRSTLSRAASVRTRSDWKVGLVERPEDPPHVRTPWRSPIFASSAIEAEHWGCFWWQPKFQWEAKTRRPFLFVAKSSIKIKTFRIQNQHPSL